MLKRVVSRVALAASAVCLVMGLAPLSGGAAQRALPGTSAGPAASSALTPLDRYLKNLRTLRVTFLQTVADAHGAEVSRSTGTLIVERPGKFRWDIHPQDTAQQTSSGKSGTAAPPGASAGGQLMVSDGRNLWYFDRDLQQVTVRPMTAALSATPAMLLSGTVDVHRHFTESNAGKRDGLDWVYVEPRSTQADFKSALFGFDGKGTLQRMILEDKLGQIVTILFQDVEVNVPVPASELTFTPPSGADVIGTPAK
ncbi:MAG TPA: outer membrane lipoprotein carrier protein LolA [Steroidobacteraceae bacterium]|jgi:outer membrane lipoprotein-sorting protein|nr:outer membrane lipoprotein carrier protein LolA [Steroidobacteraceae bacterium]